MLGPPRITVEARRETAQTWARSPASRGAGRGSRATAATPATAPEGWETLTPASARAGARYRGAHACAGTRGSSRGYQACCLTRRSKRLALRSIHIRTLFAGSNNV